MKRAEKKRKIEPIEAEKRLRYIDISFEHLEVKKLEEEDLKEVMKIIGKYYGKVDENEVKRVIRQGLSFGAYDLRLLVGFVLAWKTGFSWEKGITNEENAVYIEEPLIIPMYEGRGIRPMLIEEVEKEARKQGFNFVISLIRDLPIDRIEDVIKEKGTALEKIFLRRNYQFIKMEEGVLAVKEL